MTRLGYVMTTGLTVMLIGGLSVQIGRAHV